jgi:hypothetical protein
MKEAIIEGLKRIDIIYLIMIVSAGYFLTRDKVISPVPSKIRLPMLRVSKAWRVMIISFFIGVVLYYLRGYSVSVDRSTHIEDMLLTWIVSNSFYELFVKIPLDYLRKK